MVTLDELSTGNIEGVKIIYLADFLLKEELKMGNPKLDRVN